MLRGIDSKVYLRLRTLASDNREWILTIHVVDLFSGIMRGGLRVVLEAGYTMTIYTAVELNNLSRAIGWRVIGSLQEEFPR